MDIRTRRAMRSDLDRAAIVLGEAFSDYPWTRWTVDERDHQSRITRLQRLTLEHVGLALGVVWVTTVDDTIQSVAIWTDSADATAPNPNPAIDQLTADLEGSRHHASIAAQQQLSDWRPAQRHLYLGTVGTAPAMRGLGLATQTLLPGLELADNERVPAYLETSSESNLDFYTTLQFEVIIADSPVVDPTCGRCSERHRTRASMRRSAEPSRRSVHDGRDTGNHRSTYEKYWTSTASGSM